MPDDVTGDPTAETSTAPAAEEQAAETPEEPIDWDALDATLERAYTADPKVASDRLKKHRAIGGIAGSIAERRMLELGQQQEAQRQADAAQKAAADLEDMAQNRPLEFADKFLGARQAEKTRAQIAAVETNAAKRLMEQIGAAYHGIPEWAELNDDERGKLREAVADAHDNDALPRFNKAALDIVATRRAEKYLADRLPKEKEAWRKELEGERLGTERGPDLRRPSSTTSKPLDWASMDDKTFDEYWRKKRK